MKTELFTVSKIFNENLFRIPDYQRGYSWVEQHLKDFWLDLEQLDEEKSHYTGVLTLEPVPRETWLQWEEDVWIIKSRNYHPYYVVDGQQRLTTITILIQCIIEKCINSESLNYTPITDIRKKYIFDSKSGSISRSYIFGYEKDNPSYEFLKTKIFKEESDLHFQSEDTVYTKNLVNAKNFFLEQIENLSNEKIEVVFKKLTQQLLFNVYEISEEIDVCVAFETMNNRGKPLTTLELLKNRLIYLSQQFSNEEEGEHIKLRTIINDSWKTVYHFLGKNEKRPLMDDAFLHTHIYYYYHASLMSEFPKEEDEQVKYIRRFNDSLENLCTRQFL